MRFDDRLETVRTADLATPLGLQAAWRQLVDLVGRGRIPADAAVMTQLESLRDSVPVSARAASGRALFGAASPAVLVRLLATDDIAVGAGVLRGAALPAADWIALLPELSPQARAVLRHRRDLPAEVVRALASFGSVDFTLSSDLVDPDVVAEAAPEPLILETVAEPVPASLPENFVSIGAIARDLPVVEEALRASAPPPEPASGVFRIADVVARIEAYQARQEDRRLAPAEPVPPPERFRFETDGDGVLRWIDGIAREPLVGLSLARPARPGEAGVDGAAAGAFRNRARFAAARLLVAGSGEAAGDWTIAGVPAFDATTGRFTGYRGSARRPRPGERAAVGSADSMRQLVHELRTPTNAIAGFSEMIEHQLLGPVPAPYREQAAAIRQDSGKLLAAIDDLDTAARIESGALPLHPEPVALAPLLARIAAELGPLAAERKTALAIAPTEASAFGDSRAVERLLSRLTATMLAAAEPGETIAIDIAESGAQLLLAIDRPRALAEWAGEALLDLNDEAGPASLLGTGFALRLIRNLARAVGGALTIAPARLTLRLPAAVDGKMERTRQN